MSEEILSIEELTVQIGSDQSLRVLDSLSLKLATGEIVGLVGESGAGKTTVAKSIFRTLPFPLVVAKGRIMFRGLDLLESSAKMINKMRGSRIALIPQDPMSSLNPTFTIGAQFTRVLQNSLRYEQANLDEAGSAELRGGSMTDTARERATSCLKSVGLDSYHLDVYPHELSGGMQQRVLIAMALASNPDIIVCDEPTSALDVTTSAQILSLIREKTRGRRSSVIYITHDLRVIAQICDRVVVIYGGDIKEKADVFELFANPRHPYTKGLIESIIGGEKQSGGRIRGIPGDVPSVRMMPSGCNFRNRCSLSSSICLRRPTLRQISSRHFVSCHGEKQWTSS